MAAIPWQAEIAAVKEQVEELQADGNYRAAMSYVRKLEEARVFSMLAIEIEVGYNKLRFAEKLTS